MAPSALGHSANGPLFINFKHIVVLSSITVLSLERVNMSECGSITVCRLCRSHMICCLFLFYETKYLALRNRIHFHTMVQ